MARYKREFRQLCQLRRLGEGVRGLLRRLLEFSDIPLEESNALDGTDPKHGVKKDTVERFESATR